MLSLASQTLLEGGGESFPQASCVFTHQLFSGAIIGSKYSGCYENILSVFGIPAVRMRVVNFSYQYE